MHVDYISIGNIIMDDIILPNGSSYMGTLGGGATHASMGMRVWSEQVGLVVPIGADFADETMCSISEYFDCRGLVLKTECKTPRAWQLFEEDGTRNEIIRTGFEEMAKMIPEPDKLCSEYKSLKGVHLHCRPELVKEWVQTLRSRGNPIILWEPWDPFCKPENSTLFYENCAVTDIVSPNLLEAQTLTGYQEVEAILEHMQTKGAKIILLRMGSKGSVIRAENGKTFRIAAYPVESICDQTGAGNACCGGFIVGLAESGDLTQAGHFGSVSASFALHQFGALFPLDGLAAHRVQRLGYFS